MGYDGASYRSQLLDSEENQKELCKVKTLVLYFGNKRWNVSKELKDTFNKTCNIKDTSDNYKINVFEIAYLTEKQINMFQSDFGIIADYNRFLKLDIKKDEKGEVTMCTILDAAINKGIAQGETLKLIMLVQKKMKKGKSISKIADDLEEDEIVISPIYECLKQYPEDTERDIYNRLN